MHPQPCPRRALRREHLWPHPGAAAGVQQVPGSLAEALDALEADNEFLLRGVVFTSDLIDTWINYKRSRGVDGVQLRLHPYEFMLYYDA